MFGFFVHSGRHIHTAATRLTSRSDVFEFALSKLSLHIFFLLHVIRLESL